MKKISNPFLMEAIFVDLHGSDRFYAVMKVKETINDALILKKKQIVIVHGKGKYILRSSVHEYLKSNKFVKSYKLDNFNIGQTIVDLY